MHAAPCAYGGPEKSIENAPCPARQPPASSCHHEGRSGPAHGTPPQSGALETSIRVSMAASQGTGSPTLKLTIRTSEPASVSQEKLMFWVPPFARHSDHATFIVNGSDHAGPAQSSRSAGTSMHFMRASPGHRGRCIPRNLTSIMPSHGG